jgi:site-specific recombinase XerD
MKFKTLDQVLAAFEAASLSAGHSRNTRRGYLATVADFTTMLMAREISGPQGYFDHLARVRRVCPASVRRALNPLKFLYEKVLEQEFGSFQVAKVSKNRRIPCDLAHSDILRLLAELPRLPRLQASLLYGCGLRIESDMLKLRLKDVHLEDRMLVIQTGKGDKSRAVRLPECLLPEIARQVEACRRQWALDRAAGVICPCDSASLMRKYGERTFGTLPWYWLFPSRNVRGKARWHATDKRLTTALREAAEVLGITQRVNPHAFRHSYATNLLRSGTDIRTIQDQLGHTSVETTEIYAHAAGFRGTESPLDKLGRQATPVEVLEFPARRWA